MACTQVTLNGIANDCSFSKGGIVEAYIANWASDAYTVSGDTITAVTNSGSTAYKLFYFKKGTSQFTSTLNVDNANGVNYVSTEINLLFNRMDAAKRAEMAALAINDLNVIVKDGNGNYWGFGLDEPVTASAGDGQTGTAATDGNRYSITLLDQSQTWPYPIKKEVGDGIAEAAKSGN